MTDPLQFLHSNDINKEYNYIFDIIKSWDNESNDETVENNNLRNRILR